MMRASYITTSWDDGHPLDCRVAELLAKFGLPGTFYVPRIGEHETMTTTQLRDLSSTFEIGAHTLHHTELTAATDQQAWHEITGSKAWLEDSTGKACPMFCPPKGQFTRRHLNLIQQAGFKGVRSVELLSLSYPRRIAGLMVLPTTIQAHPHALVAYAKNSIKRASFKNLWRYIVHGRSTDWVKLARSLLSQAIKHGGVFHLWGHSWEVQKNGQWQRLEEVLRLMSDFTNQSRSVTNLQVCQGSGAKIKGKTKIPSYSASHGECA